MPSVTYGPNREEQYQRQLPILYKMLNNPKTSAQAMQELQRIQNEMSPEAQMKRREMELSIKQKEQAINQEGNKFQQVGTDMLGNPKYGFVNPVTQSITYPDGGGSGGMSLSPEAEASMKMGGVHGDDFLKLLPPAIADEIKKELGIKSPSKVFKEIGTFTMQGLAQGIDQNTNVVDISARRAGQIAVEGLQKSLSNLGDVALNELDLQPKIAPVIDLTEFRKDVSTMNGLIKDTPVIAQVSMEDRKSVV